MNELDKVSEKILKHIVKNDCRLSPKEFYNLGLFKHYPEKELAECLNNLYSLGFIYLNQKDDLLCSKFKARQYLLIKKKKFLQFFLLNVLIPFLIALFTAYLTAKLTNSEIIVLINDMASI